MNLTHNFLCALDLRTTLLAAYYEHSPKTVVPISTMKAKYIQNLLGSIFLLLGTWALLFPSAVETFVLAPDYFIGSTSSALLIGCFGAQAILCSILIFCTTFSARTFLVFGLVGSLPFFGFNYYFVFILPIFTDWMLLDFVGNVGILMCGIIGWQIKLGEERVARNK
ncbi:MAG: hypothetical protein ACI96M_001656 [Candidatus Azotimanducaceae bacterium]